MKTVNRNLYLNARIYKRIKIDATLKDKIAIIETASDAAGGKRDYEF